MKAIVSQVSAVSAGEIMVNGKWQDCQMKQLKMTITSTGDASDCESLEPGDIVTVKPSHFTGNVKPFIDSEISKAAAITTDKEFCDTDYYGIAEIADDRTNNDPEIKIVRGTYTMHLEDADGKQYRPPTWLCRLIGDAHREGEADAKFQIRQALGIK